MSRTTITQQQQQLQTVLKVMQMINSPLLPFPFQMVAGAFVAVLQNCLTIQQNKLSLLNLGTTVVRLRESLLKLPPGFVVCSGQAADLVATINEANEFVAKLRRDSEKNALKRWFAQLKTGQVGPMLDP
ncbi:hypothetical protein HDU98_007286 [Podochytrium sp. JEL0797]|nr:hypothetical protein HDU98_007286 [Podochytrium sp. JEL0797]